MDFTPMKDFMQRLCDWRIPGNTISVYHKHKEIFRYNAGYSDVESKTPMQGEELFSLYSCSKIATVTAALQLYERGFFLLDDPLYAYLPEFRDMYIKTENGDLQKAKNPITLRHLFTMTAGFTYDLNTENIRRGKKETNGTMPTVEAMKYIAKDPIMFEPGTHWNYSICHDVLAAVVEVISGERFSEYVNEHIMKPAGVGEVYYHRPESVRKKMATLYEYRNSNCVDLVAAQINGSGKDGILEVRDKGLADFELGTEYDSGGAGIAVSIPAYAKFADALANGGTAANGERILAPGTVELMRADQLKGRYNNEFCMKQVTGYGYGLGVRTVVDRAVSGFNGKSGEFGWGGAAGATILCDPDTGFSYVYAHHMHNPQEEYYQPRLRNVAYTCMGMDLK